jgi:hypothetical protein
VDLSAIIFVVLALAWAVYLIPKALSHHDEMASDRLVEGHSDKVRILSRKRSVTVTETVVETTDDTEAEAPAESVVPVPVPVPVTVRAVTALPTRASARRAARNRRRVLTVLVTALAVVVALAAFSVVPWWSTAVPGALVVAFLVVARISVRRMQQARATRRTPLAEAFTEEQVAPVSQGVSQSVSGSVSGSFSGSFSGPDVEVALDQLNEDTVGVDRQELEAALADDGSLWDPLPMTLPTYVNKARARRTVRTIELTGINSSGHDQGDSALAREAATTVVAEPTEAEQRKVAGA